MASSELMRELRNVGAAPHTLCTLLSGDDLANAENIVCAPRFSTVIAADTLCAQLNNDMVPDGAQLCAGCGAALSSVGAAAVWHDSRLLCALHCAGHIPCRAAAFDGLDSVIFLLRKPEQRLCAQTRHWSEPHAFLVPHAAYVAALRNSKCGPSTRWALVLSHSALQCTEAHFPERAFTSLAFDALPADARRCVRPDCGALLCSNSAARVMSALRRGRRVWQMQIYLYCARSVECHAAAIGAQCAVAPDRLGAVEYSLRACDACGKCGSGFRQCVRCGIATFCSRECERAYAKYHVDRCAQALLMDAPIEWPWPSAASA